MCACCADWPGDRASCVWLAYICRALPIMTAGGGRAFHGRWAGRVCVLRRVRSGWAPLPQGAAEKETGIVLFIYIYIFHTETRILIYSLNVKHRRCGEAVARVGHQGVFCGKHG